MMKKYLLFILLVALFLEGKAKVVLPHLLGPGMVLQQKSMVLLWGKAAKNTQISILTSWDKKLYSVKTGADGKFSVNVKTPSAGGPYQITFNDGSKLILSDILIGEVWLCSGQSNMDIPIKGYLNQPILNAAELLADAGDLPIRMFTVGKELSIKPKDEVNGSWKNDDPENVNNFSAVGYQFAKMLQKKLKVPVGIIQSTWGGTNIIGWMSKNAMQGFDDYTIPTDTTKKLAPSNPTAIFNAMIYPLTNFKIKGVLWYQGEANRLKPSTYSQLMLSMVTDWRKIWNVGDFPFYFVQIAPWKYTSSGALVPYLQEAQVKANKMIVNSGMVTTIDLGSESTIHPPDKTTVAQRLFYLALSQTYQVKGLYYQSPSYKSVKFDNDTAKLVFNNTKIGFYANEDGLANFEIAGSNQVFYPAIAKITKDGIDVYANKVNKPVAVRYAFKDWVVGKIYNVEGLPLIPFRTDEWPSPPEKVYQ
jgi:sialate O-acetylesterase